MSEKITVMIVDDHQMHLPSLVILADGEAERNVISHLGGRVGVDLDGSGVLIATEDLKEPDGVIRSGVFVEADGMDFPFRRASKLEL